MFLKHWHRGLLCCLAVIALRPPHSGRNLTAVTHVCINVAEANQVRSLGTGAEQTDREVILDLDHRTATPVMSQRQHALWQPTHVLSFQTFFYVSI